MIGLAAVIGARSLRWAAALVALALVACNPARALIATPDDYAAYRRVRVADTAEGRLAAAWDYLRNHPDGRYADRVRTYFEKMEPVYYKVRRRNVAGLETYLKALPDGPHADDALARLMLLTGRERRESADIRAFTATQQRLDARQKQREAAAVLVSDWVVMLLDPKLWEVPLARGPRAFVVRYELALPQPLCEPRDEGGRRCFKAVERRYDVVTAGNRFDRSVAFEVELELDSAGRPQGVEIRGAGLFVRSEEAHDGEPIDDLDAASVRRAQRAFAERLGRDLLARDLLCSGTTDPDGRTNLDCEGLRLVLEPGPGEDRIVVSPMGEPSVSHQGD
jgi:hypothetical protein